MPVRFIDPMKTDTTFLLFWKSRKGLFLQIIIVLFPSSLFLRSGSWLLLGLFSGVLLSSIGLKIQQHWSDVGLKKPHNGREAAFTVFISVAALIVVSFILRHIITFLTSETPKIEAFNPFKGNPMALLVGLLVAWIFGAFGEEMFFRGFLLNAFYRLLPGVFFNDRIRWGLSLLTTSVLVGFGHTYQGITGIILTGMIGFCFGLIYLKSHHNLWPCILTHGLYDTIAFLMVFSGFNLDQRIK